MKETLDEQSRLALIQYRIERAEETIEEASLLSKESHFNAAINRLYYACFYAARSENNDWNAFCLKRLTF